MSTYILMKILESAPTRYDKGIRLLTFGKLDASYDRLTANIQSGQKVLDIGCGTGALSLRAAQKGAMVKGIDVNSQILEIAQQRAEELQLSNSIEFLEMGVTELENEETESYDIVMSGLCFSELTEDEFIFTLEQINRILKPDGLLLVADEVKPDKILNRIIIWLIRFPLLIISYIFTQTATHAIKDLPQKMRNSGLTIRYVRLTKAKNFIEIVAQKYDDAQNELV